MKTILFSFILAFSFTIGLPAQDTTWFDANWDKCLKSEAMFFHLESQKGDLVSYTDCFKSNNQV